MNIPHIGELAAVATAVLWTFSALAWTAAGHRIGALAVSFLRLVITCALLVGYGWLVYGMALHSNADAKTWLLLGMSGFFGFFLCDLCLFKAFLLIGPRLTLLVFSLSPPTTALLAWPWLGETLDWHQWLAMGITVTGVSWVVLEKPSQNHPHSLERGSLLLGVLLSLVAAVAQAIGAILAREGIGEYDVASGTFIRALGAMAGYLPMITILRRWPAMLTAFSCPRIVGILTFGAIAGPFVGVLFWMVALRHCEAGVVVTITSTMPVIILPFAIFLYRERISPRAAAGAILSVAGVALLML